MGDGVKAMRNDVVLDGYVVEEYVFGMGRIFDFVDGDEPMGRFVKDVGKDEHVVVDESCLEERGRAWLGK